MRAIPFSVAFKHCRSFYSVSAFTAHMGPPLSTPQSVTMPAGCIHNNMSAQTSLRQQRTRKLRRRIAPRRMRIEEKSPSETQQSPAKLPHITTRAHAAPARMHALHQSYSPQRRPVCFLYVRGSVRSSGGFQRGSNPPEVSSTPGTDWQQTGERLIQRVFKSVTLSTLPPPRSAPSRPTQVAGRYGKCRFQSKSAEWFMAQVSEFFLWILNSDGIKWRKNLIRNIDILLLIMPFYL